MPIITLIIVLVVIGLLLWVVNTYIPMQPMIKRILNIVVLIAVILWLLQAFGLLGGLNNMRVGALETSSGAPTVVAMETAALRPLLG